MDKVSVIVPVYKVEEYLQKCVDSIIDQSYTNLEIILVDDGSPDNCPAICDGYAKKDSRVRVIHKMNGGASDARNTGIDSSTGEYIFFVDGDDWIEKTAIQDCVDIIISEKSEMVVTKAYNLITDTGTSTIGNNCDGSYYTLKPEEALIDVIEENLKLSPWGNLYRRNIFEKVRFIKGYIYEDLELIPRLFLEAKIITLYNKNVYNYLLRKGSVMHHESVTFNAQLPEITEKGIDLFIAKVKNRKQSEKLVISMLMLLMSWYEKSVIEDRKGSENRLFRINSRKIFHKYLILVMLNEKYRMKRKLHFFVTSLFPCFLLKKILKSAYKKRGINA